MSHCHCGSGRQFDCCCQPLQLGKAVAASPEQLMRSRYSAFVEGAAAYLLDTHDPDTRDDVTEAVLARSCEESRFVGLQIVDAPPPKGEQGEVEFRAWYRQGEDILALWERSQFRRLEGRWFYSRGEIRPAVKLGRNDPCPCGSGKKAKRCCL
ncbi:zinc chelation protein SecC [Ferrimonas sediminicola]|uniref:Zinc chelation protein SecC n=1 Tax=Ferrimonas sediminicola TaxID=2569538 RepID=A0A4U1BI57_9GAMM|nr:YchJ family metal-binding protein [Ferrimonas sediminicola]TKB50219.1 zinc chelation protein SecC [Ferrimonas sediminicola]